MPATRRVGTARRSAAPSTLNTMYTRCPHCRTVFSVTDQQLAARGGVVRCGNCGAVFRGDHYFTRQLPAPPIPAPRGAGQKTDSGPPRRHAPLPLPSLEELLTGRRGSRTRPVFWWLGIVLAGSALLAQLVFFYANGLVAMKPELRPLIADTCVYLGCELVPQMEPGLVELSNTAIAPHAKYRNALSLQAVLINRASFTQPYPQMEVTITDHHGTIVGRRVFAPSDYLSRELDANAFMVPNLVVRASVEFTNPNPKAEGYEIRLLPNTLPAVKTG